VELRAYNRRVETPFGLLGNDENALTFALGYTLQQCPRLLQQLLKSVGFGGLRIANLERAVILLQRGGADLRGITDIEIMVDDKLHLVIEAKVGLSVPTETQCATYLDRFRTSGAAQKGIVILTTIPNEPTLRSYQARGGELATLLHGLHWSEIVAAATRLAERSDTDNDARFWLRQFCLFAERGYRMRSFTEEVWIVPASNQPLWEGGWSFYDTHVEGRIYYREDQAHRRPLYLALRNKGQITAIQKVLRVEHDAIPITLLPILEKVAGDDNWPRRPHTVWHLDAPTELPRAIPTGDPYMRGRHAHCDIDILLASTTLAEAIERMRERNGADAI